MDIAQFLNMEQKMATLVNSFRASNGKTEEQRRPLQINFKYALKALEHSVAQNKAKKMSHEGSDQRLREAGATYENVAAGQQTPEEAFKAWETSTMGHREAMLNAKRDMAVAYDGNYWTALFG